MAWYLLLLGIFAELLIFTRGQPGNQPPTWVSSSYSRLTQGISEDTLVGTSLAQLLCIDPEGDNITYGITSGKAVRVTSNGIVYLVVKLDFEQKDTLGYDLTFSCVDIYPETGYSRHQLVTTNLQISVNDANDNPPLFQVDNIQGYSFSVREDAKVGTVVEASIQTGDKDRTGNAVLRTMYLICNSTNATERANLPETSIAMCEKFKLTYTQVSEGVYNATVTLIAPLDYEDRPVYSSKIVAMDGPGLAVSFTSTVNIQINVIDTQDQPPIFTNPGEATTVSEGAPVGTTVMDLAISARDGDVGDKRAVALSIVRDPKNAFNLTVPAEVTPGEGIYYSRLIIRNKLDRETNLGAYEFVVLATEIDKNTSLLTTATATATYSVFVSDVNDNPPIFSQNLYVVNLTEIDTVNRTSTMQVTGLHIVCSDRDEPSNARYTVTIVSQIIGLDANATNVTDAYSISPDLPFFTGNASMFLKVDNPFYLDYDIPKYRVHTLVLVARETGTKELFSGSTTVSIFLQDINDNAPQFDQTEYRINISEASSYPIDLIPVTAHDKDTGRNGDVRYHLEGGFSGKFSINNVTGVLRLIGPLDYETASEYVFLVYATDQAAEARSSQVQVTVNVVNANDVPPRFRQSQYQTSVAESSLVFLNPLTVTAVDDEADTKQITYRIVSGQSSNNAFVLNSTTGELTLRNYLDFADTPRDATGNNTGFYTLEIEASDNGSPPLTATVSVKITVIDENNHPPVLNPSVYFAVLSEIAKEGTSVIQVKGTDSDAGDNGKITFRLGAGSTDNFAVDESSGWITVGPAPFDYDVQNQYRLIILATDGGAPQKSATAIVTVNITDSNNKDPYFDEFLYLINVDDRTAVNTVIHTVTARDADSTNSLEYSIVYTSIRATNPSGGAIVSTSPYDYREAFGVNQNGGIFIKNKLDHNIVAETTFELMGRDKNTEVGTGTGTTQITIMIRGEVYQNITFDMVNQVFMNEDAKVGYSPITVTARDPNNQPVSNYIKVSGSDYFSVEQSSGRTTLNKEIDYETDQTPNHLHMVVVSATSGLQSATVTVTISIVDVNDNDPVFQQPSYTAQISETAIYPTMVVSIYATDADSKSYGPLGFDLSGLDSDDFTIFLDPVPSGQQSSRRGQVIVAQGKTLDYNRRGQYDLTVIVGDNIQMTASSIRRYSVAPLTIYVIDENNHSPVFKEQRRSLAIPETAEIGRSIATLVATDEDRGRNGEIVYSLETTNDPESASGVLLFSIGQQSGTVTVARSLIGQGNKVFHFQVRARDKGDIPNSNIMMLDITVLSTEDNDGNPKWLFPPNEYVVFAPEETKNYLIRDSDNSSRFFNVIARTGTEVVYSLSPFSDKASSFSVNRTTGEITIVDLLDREIQETYNLLIFAEDTNDTAKYRTGLQLVVKLLDKNDNDATFTNPKNYSSCQKIDQPLRVTVKENMGVNVTIATVKACDPDFGLNAAIMYQPYKSTSYCEMNNNLSALWVDPNGNLITRRNIDYEQDKEFIMCVQALSVIPSSSRKKRAFDMTQIVPNVTNVAYIYIVVEDENDNGPKFPSDKAFGIVQTEPGTGPFLTLNAQDVDGDKKNIILYRIETSVFYPQGNASPSPFSGAFTIREGAMYPVLSSYQQYAGGHFVLKVVATDSLNNSLTDSQTVTIYVYEKGLAVKVILNLKPEIGAQYSQTIVRRLDGVSTRYRFVFLRVSEHTKENAVDSSKTDVCFLAVDSSGENVLNIRDVIELLDQDRYQNILKTVEYHVIEQGQCYPSPSSEKNIKWRDLWWVLVAVAIFLFVCCVILIIAISILYDRYKRFMETRKTYMVTQ